MLIGYARVSKADGSQVADLQHDALVRAGVSAKRIYEDKASGKRDDRPNLEACLKSLRRGDVLVVCVRPVDRIFSPAGSRPMMERPMVPSRRVDRGEEPAAGRGLGGA